MKTLPQILDCLQGQLIVSCQADPQDAFYGPEMMARFAQAALRGGAAGLRLNGAADVAEVRRHTDAPIIGIAKERWTDGRILITPTFEAAAALARAGADLVALDCTVRGRRYGALDRLRQIRAELGLPVMADIATLDEAQAAIAAGADLVAPTLRGYTEDTQQITGFDPELLDELCRAVSVPVIAEGRISSPGQVRRAIEAGALAVVVGTAITRPHEITRAFVSAVHEARRPAAYLGIDLGGTNTKFGAVSPRGELLFRSAVPTPAAAGRAALLDHLKQTASACAREAAERGISAAALGIATAGWVDRRSGTVAYATETLPGWTGTPIASEIAPAVGLPVAVENDANALAVGEKHFGLARSARDFVCFTLGTGVGGGCYTAGRLNRGRHSFANALGHIPLSRSGPACACGNKGCLEVFANAAALLRYAGGGYGEAKAVIAAANAGDAQARRAIRRLAEYLAAGAAAVIHMLDPELLVFSGGLVEDNPLLIESVRERLPREVNAWPQRRIEVRASELGYYGGVFGAAAVAAEQLSETD
jgi:N-acetylmannosamine-6-phosphate 2-epimerase / N-acetylmannosamine kinase